MGFQRLVEPRWLEKEAIAAEWGRGKHASARHTAPNSDGDGIGKTAGALVKKVVFDEVQCFPTNSTMQSSMCVKPEKSFELTRPVGAVELRANAAEGRKTGDAMDRASWHLPFLGHPSAKFFLGNAGSVQKRRKSLTSCWQSSRPLPISGMPQAVMVQLSDSNRVWNWALSW